MRYAVKIFIALAFAGAAVSGPVQAQNLIATLSGVTFDDGGTASGYFDFNPTTYAVDAFDITTTATASAPGETYQLGNTISSFDLANLYLGDADEFELVLRSATEMTGPGLYELSGTISNNEGDPSAEFGQSFYRQVSSGDFAVTAAPAPEISSFLSFGLLALSGGACFAFARRRRQAPRL